MHQKELFFHYLTVREHLIFHAINRMSRIRTPQQCAERVEKVRVCASVCLGVCLRSVGPCTSQHESSAARIITYHPTQLTTTVCV